METCNVVEEGTIGSLDYSYLYKYFYIRTAFTVCGKQSFVIGALVVAAELIK